MVDAFVYAFVLALGLILPLGPQNSFILSIGSHSQRFRQTLPGVVTAAVCDTLLIVLAVMGVSVVVAEIHWLKITLALVGSAFLFYFGWTSLRAATDKAVKDVFVPTGYVKQIAMMATFSILNPFAWLDTVVVIGSNAMLFSGSRRMVFTLTCILVSWLWFLLLARVGMKMGQSLKNTAWRQYIITAIMWGSAMILLYRGIYS